jgi:hypothetical protein
LTNQEEDPAAHFLQGPLFKKARPPQVYLETYDTVWRAGAQAIGYREAAETLIDVIIEGDRAVSRTLLHPLLFLYRHSVELKLKRLIEEYGSGPPPTGHRLDRLWPACKAIIEHILPRSDFDKVDRLLEELHAVDPDSQPRRQCT